MKVTFLGTGTSQGVPVVACDCDVCKSHNSLDKRLRSSLLIETQEVTLVIDAGPDFRQQMLRAQIKHLDAILLTHEHYDHIAGLDDIRAFNWVQKEPTDIYAMNRVLQSVKRIFSYVFASKKYPGIPQMNLFEVDNDIFEIKGISIMPIHVMHYKLPVLGYRFGSMAYITDMKTMTESEMGKLYGLDVLIVNALRKEPHLSHMNLEEALLLIEKLSPKKAYLTHVSHMMGLTSEVAKELPYNVELAYDGLSFDL